MNAKPKRGHMRIACQTEILPRLRLATVAPCFNVSFLIFSISVPCKWSLIQSGWHQTDIYRICIYIRITNWPTQKPGSNLITPNTCSQTNWTTCPSQLPSDRCDRCDVTSITTFVVSFSNFDLISISMLHEI